MIIRSELASEAFARPHFRQAQRTGTGLITTHFGACPASTSPTFLVPGISRSIEIKVASEHEEWEQAFQLLAANYRARGYEAPGEKPFRFTPFHVLPDTTILVAKHLDQVVATLSLVPDTTLLGLPLESIYAAEVAELRGQRRRMAEAIGLADADLNVREFVQVFKALIKLAMQFHARRGGDSWVITVNPRHRSFYQKVVGFVPLGPRRSYPSVQDHPAEAYLLAVEEMEIHAPGMYHEVFDEPLPDEVLASPPWSADRVRYFGNRSTQVDPRTVEELLLVVEHLGSSPRWLEGEASAPPTTTSSALVCREELAERCGC
jgi:hypothetical protein